MKWDKGDVIAEIMLGSILKEDDTNISRGKGKTKISCETYCEV